MSTFNNKCQEKNHYLVVLFLFFKVFWTSSSSSFFSYSSIVYEIPYFIDIDGGKIKSRALDFRGNCWYGWTGDNLEKDRAVCLPGDVLIQSGSHIVLIVGTDDAKKSYIVAESTGSNLNTGYGGVKLSYYPYKYSNYFCSDLSSFYKGSSTQVEEEWKGKY